MNTVINAMILVGIGSIIVIVAWLWHLNSQELDEAEEKAQRNLVYLKAWRRKNDERRIMFKRLARDGDRR